MKRKRSSEEDTLVNDEKPLKKQKVDSLPSFSDFSPPTQITPQTPSQLSQPAPGRVVAITNQTRNSQFHPLNTSQSQNSPTQQTQPTQQPTNTVSLPLPPQTAFPFRRSVLDERANPRHLLFRNFNEERRKRKLAPLSQTKFTFLEEHRSREPWQFTLDEIKEEILRFFMRNDGSYTYKEIFEGIREVPYVRRHLEGRRDEEDKLGVANRQIKRISYYGFLEKKTNRANGMSGRPTPLYSLLYFEGIQDYQISPAVSRRNAILYSLTFTNRIMSMKDVVVDINTRIYDKKEFRIEEGGGIASVMDLFGEIKELESQKVIKSEKHVVTTNGIPTSFYFLTSRPNLDRSFVPPPKPNDEQRKKIILKIIRENGEVMTGKEIYESSNELSRWSMKRMQKDLKVLFDDGLLNRRRKSGKGKYPFEYFIKEEEELSLTKDTENSLSIPPPPPPTVNTSTKTSIKKETALEEKDEDVVVVSTPPLPPSTYEEKYVRNPDGLDLWYSNE